MSAKASSRSIPLKRQETPLLVPKEIAPQFKTSVGITYAVLSDAILATAKSARESGRRLAPETIVKFNDALFASTRLTQWFQKDFAKGYQQWRIYANDGITFVIVDKKAIVIHGNGWDHEIKDALIAQSLFTALDYAQSVVSSTIEEGPMTDEEQESYFDGGNSGASLDEALADQHVEPLSADDAELIHDVTTEEALDEDQRQEDGPEPIVTVSQQFIDDISAKKYVSKTTSLVDAEVERVKEEYPELNKGKVPIGTRSEVNRFKSLQGRILTIMDAAIGDKDQRAAVKTLINKEFRHTMNQLDKSENSHEA